MWRAWDLSEREDFLDQQAALGAWLVYAPGVCVNSYWIVAAIALRDIAGMPPARRQYDGATHEIMFAALDTDPEDAPDPDGALGEPVLPLDLAYQFDDASDAQAAEVLDKCVHAIMTGTIAPDSDFRRDWARRIEATLHMMRSAKRALN